MSGTNIEWTHWPDRRGVSWNPIRAEIGSKTGWHCEKVSPGCAHCYAEAYNRRFGTGLDYSQSSTSFVYLDTVCLHQATTWRKPRAAFVCSMTDLFGNFIEDDVLDVIFRVMDSCPDHLFLLLTKRAERMATYLSDREPRGHVWAGVSMEDEERAERRLPALRSIAAAGWNTWVSAEPLLAPIDWANLMPVVKWLVLGGESGPNARPTKPGWFQTAVNSCQQGKVACFVKQLGANVGGERFKNLKAADPAEWSKSLRVRQFPGQTQEMHSGIKE